MTRAILLLLALGACARPSATPTDDTAIAAPPANRTALATPVVVSSPSPSTAALPSPTAAPELAPAVDRQRAATPADVERFIAAYEECEHWAGEEPYDAARRKEIVEGVKASCTGIDARLARLTRKYAANPALSAKLADYSPVRM